MIAFLPVGHGTLDVEYMYVCVKRYVQVNTRFYTNHPYKTEATERKGLQVTSAASTF